MVMWCRDWFRGGTSGAAYGPHRSSGRCNRYWDRAGRKWRGTSTSRRTCFAGVADDERESWVTLHQRREKCWFDAVRYLLQHDPCDLTAVVFDGVDKIQHICWPLLDPELASHRASAADRRLRDRCVEYFRDLDGYLAEIARLAGPDAQMFVVSDHGFGPTREVFRVNVWLHQQGYLEWATSPSATDEVVRESVARRVDSNFALVDWQQTIAYANTPSSNGIVLRESALGTSGGPVEYEALRQEISSGLLRVMSPLTGRPIVRRVIAREDAFPGELMSTAPDLYLELSDHGFVSIRNVQPIVGERPDVTGTHRPNGIIVASGPGIERDSHIPDLGVADIAPLVLHSLGTAIPDDMDGQVPESLFEARWLASNPPVVAASESSDDVSPPADAGGASVSPEEDARILQRLAALGYVELDD